MRTLIFYTAVLLSKQLLARESLYTLDKNDLPVLQKIDVSYTHLSYSEKNQNLNIDQSVPSEQLSVASTFKYKKSNLGFSFLKSKNDYSLIRLRGQDGTEKNLNSVFDKDEFNGSATLSTYIGSHNFSALVGSSLSESPYSQTSQQIQYNYRGQYDSYKAGLSLSQQTTNQPENYFINRNFQTQKSTDQLITRQIQFFYEQVLSEDFKTQIVFLSGNRLDRPNNTGYILKTGYAINQKLFLRSQLGTIFEANTELKNNRGRYSNRFFDTELNYNYSYKLQLTSGYGLNIETEKETFAQPDAQVGHDIYSLSSRYRLDDITIQASVDQRQSNLGTNEYNFSGGLSWNL